MSAKKEATIAVLMRFVITPKDPTTAHVNQDMEGTEIIAQVTSFLTWPFFMPSKAILFLFFHDKMLFIAIFLDSRPYYPKIFNGKLVTLGMTFIFDGLSPNMAGIRNFAFFCFFSCISSFFSSVLASLFRKMRGVYYAN